MSEWKMTHSAGVWHFVILKGFLSITVVKVGLDKFMVKINGMEVKKLYPTLEDAQTMGLKGAKKLLGIAQEVIQKGENDEKIQ